MEDYFRRAWWDYVYPLYSLIFLQKPLQYLSLKFFAKPKEGERTLEVGIGSLALYKLYKDGDFVGCDYSEDSISRSRKISKKLGSKKNRYLEELVICRNEYLPFRQDCFDHVVSNNGCECVEEAHRVLKDGADLTSTYLDLGWKSLIIKEEMKSVGFEDVETFPSYISLPFLPGVLYCYLRGLPLPLPLSLFGLVPVPYLTVRGKK